MASNPQSRKWTLTINNPQDCGLDRDGIRKNLKPIFLFTLNLLFAFQLLKTVSPPHT